MRAAHVLTRWFRTPKRCPEPLVTACPGLASSRAPRCPVPGVHGLAQAVGEIVKARAPTFMARVGERAWLQPAGAAVEMEVSGVGPAAQPDTDDDADDRDQGRQVSAGDLDDRDCRAPT